MELIHTSPVEITKISKTGRFGGFLFFSAHEYVQTSSEEVFSYKIEVPEESIIDASSLFYRDDSEKLEALVEELASRLSIENDDAEALIEGKKTAYDIDGVDSESAADADWDAQLFSARAAKALGFRGVRVNDEQGCSYLIDMIGHESELEKA